MATAPIDAQGDATGKAPRRKSPRRSTSHLKLVPESRSLRETLRARTVEAAALFDPSRPPTKDEMEVAARAMLAEMDLSEGYVGWTMVMLMSSFWQDQVAAVSPERRLLLLPHCLKHAEGCPADYDDFGLDCERCGACSIADFRTMAETLGYKVLVAEGSPIVLKIIVSGYVDAIVGVACLNVLEKSIDKILLAGIPCLAVPLLSSDCRNTSVDENWVEEMIRTEHQPVKTKTRSYVHLLRGASGIFERDEIARIAPLARHGAGPLEPVGSAEDLDPLRGTEAIAYDFLCKGGKYSRPFVTLAVYDALSGGQGTLGDGAEHVAGYSDSIRRVAMAIETFHKASLVHDDIEDGDAYRYGEPTVHRDHGIATAINVGDYLIGLGYRLVARESGELGAAAVADIVGHLAEAHIKLSEGQGAELLWRDARDKRLKAIDALKIYALKTAPAFDVALYAGMRLADQAEAYSERMGLFARHLGIAFQILNDLQDWEVDDDNKKTAGADVLGGRPTLLWALALEALGPEDTRRLVALVSEDAKAETAASDSNSARNTVEQVRRLYRKAGVFETARRLVDKYRERAEAIADEIESDEFRRLLYYLVDTVLSQPASVPVLVTPTIASSVVPSASR